MSKIYTFLQKRKVHGYRHGIFMVIMAYVLSFLMLILGSDVFYNISSRAAGIMNVTDEATKELSNKETLSPIFTELKTMELKTIQTNLINPYDITDDFTSVSEEESAEKNVSSENTNWFLGYAMDYDEYNNLLEQMNYFKSLQKEDLTIAENTEDTIESFSIETTKTLALPALTKTEIEILERIVEAEATGEDMQGKILIANVIFNRIADDDFPDTVKKVVFQKVKGDYQFSPVSDERIWSVKITKSTKEAVSRALQGEDYSEGALYFMARKRAKKKNAKWFDQNLKWLFQYGGHEFYKNK